MPATIANRLLLSLSQELQKSLENKVESVPLPVGTSLFEPGQHPKHAFLITSGIASVVTDMQNGSVVEVGLFGNEAVPGVSRLLGDQHGPTRCFMQVSGTGLRMKYEALRQLFDDVPELHARVLQFIQYDLLILQQLSACNRLHEVEQRLARWLLMVSDRLDSDEVPLTQEFLAAMLGTRRSTVTLTAGVLQRAGLIEYHRGFVRIRDRQRLEKTACECYPVVRGLYHDLYRVAKTG